MAAINRRSALVLALGAPFAARAARAADWPTKPMRLIVPYAPGGGADAVARILARHVGDSLGQSIVVENKGGAGSIIGTAARRVGHDQAHRLGRPIRGTRATHRKRRAQRQHQGAPSFHSGHRPPLPTVTRP